MTYNKGFIRETNGMWGVETSERDFLPLHPTQEVMIQHDVVLFKKKKKEDVVGMEVEYESIFNSGRGPWLYALAKGFKSSLDYDTEW